jgi:ribosomal protein S27E
MTHLTPIRPIEQPIPRRDAPPFPGSPLRKAELADRMRAAYFDVGCPACDQPSMVHVADLKDVTRAVVTCNGCGAPYRRDEAVSLALLGAIGRNPR